MFAEKIAEEELNVAEHCRYLSVILRHYMISLYKRLLMMCRSGSFFKIMCHRGMQILNVKFVFVGVSQYTYAPVYIGRETVHKIIFVMFCDVCTYIECLMAYKHSVTERTPVKTLGGR